jgi:hypothetical protein
MDNSKMSPFAELCLRVFGWIFLELIGGLLYLLINAGSYFLSHPFGQYIILAIFFLISIGCILYYCQKKSSRTKQENTNQEQH